MLPRERYIIKASQSAREAMQVLNDIGIPNLAVFVTDEKDCLTGSLSDGDIRRGLLKGLGVTDPVSKFMNPQCSFFVEGENNFEKVKQFKSKDIRFAPVVDAKSKIITVLDLSEIKSIIPVEAVLMAGGEGVRLKPLTDNTPKSLLKVGDKPIIQHNIERLKSYGVNKFHLSVNYLADKIIDAIGKGDGKGTVINYVKEPRPLGTIGSVKLIEGFASDAVLLMNSDLLTNIDFDGFYARFQSSGADMLVATIPYHIEVPYAVMEMNDKEEVTSFREKPRYVYYSNAGIYLFRKSLLSLIPDNKPFDATHFMEAVMASGKKLISYPILGYWLDIGRIEDYNKAQEDIKHIRF